MCEKSRTLSRFNTILDQVTQELRGDSSSFIQDLNLTIDFLPGQHTYINVPFRSDPDIYALFLGFRRFFLFVLALAVTVTSAKILMKAFT